MYANEGRYSQQRIPYIIRTFGAVLVEKQRAYHARVNKENNVHENNMYFKNNYDIMNTKIKDQSKAMFDLMLLLTIFCYPYFVLRCEPVLMT